MSERHQDMCLGCEEEVWRHNVPLDDARPYHPIDHYDLLGSWFMYRAMKDE